MRLPVRLVPAALVACAVLTVAAYLPSIDGEFQFDDYTSLQINRQLRDPVGYLSGLTPLEFLGPGRPLPDLVYAVHLATTGMARWPIHASSLAWHLLAAGLAFLYARRLLAGLGHPRAGPLAAAAAGLFALHPLQTEAVSYAAQLAEVMSSGLALGALLLLHRADAAATPRARWGQAAAGALVLWLALGAKTVAVTVPAVALLAAVVLGGAAPGGPGAAVPGPWARARRALLTGLPAWLVSGAAVVRVLTALRTEESAGPNAGIGPWRYLLSQGRATWLYLRLLFAPAGQNVQHTFPPSGSLAEPATLTAAVAVLALLGAAGWLWWRAERGGARQAVPARVAAFAVLWWFTVLSPTSSVVPIVDLVAEHRLYLALLGPALAVVVAADAALAARGLGWRWGAGLAAAAWLALAGATALRAAVWRTAVSLWADAAEKSPTDARVAGNLAYALQAVGRTGEARAEFQRAMRLPATPRQRADNARNYAALEAERGDNVTALSIADMGVAVAPFDYELRVNRALILHDLGRAPEALQDGAMAVRLAPGEPATHHALGLALIATGQPAAALTEARAALRIDPSYSHARRLEFTALSRLGQREEACAAWRRLRAENLATPANGVEARNLGCGR